MGIATSHHQEHWRQDYERRVNPDLMNMLLRRAVPALEWTGWEIKSVERGYCETVLPLVVQTTNQHGTHQAALISLSADYTGGMALTTLLHNTPLTGIHTGQKENAASLWLANMDVKYEQPSASHLRATCRIDAKTQERIRSRFFAGRVVLSTLEVEFWSEDDQRVAVAQMKYFAQATEELLRTRNNGERSPMAKLNLRTSARIIAGLRAMSNESASMKSMDANHNGTDHIANKDQSFLRIDQPHDRIAAGTHGMLQAQRMQSVLPQLASMVSARTLHCDQAVRDMGSPQQLVVLGAGLDMRAFRLANHLRDTVVFELDLPEMLEERRHVLRRLETQVGQTTRAIQCHCIEADFIKDDVGELLQRHPQYSSEALTLATYEGCSMYFTSQQNQDILSSLRRSLGNAQSRIWMDVVTPNVIDASTADPNIHEFVRRMDSIGERFIFGLADSKDFLQSCGFSELSCTTAGQFVQSDDPSMHEYKFLLADAKDTESRELE